MSKVSPDLVSPDLARFTRFHIRKGFFLYFYFCLWIIICFVQNTEAANLSNPTDTGLFTYHPVEVQEPVLNPGYGFTFPNYGRNQNLTREIKAWCDIAYKRFTWADLEPQENQTRFEIIKNWIAERKKEGFRVSFGVMSSNVSRQCSPLWIFDKGVPGVLHREGKQMDPVYWDPVYLELLARFIKKMGNALSNGEGIEFIDMRNIGVFGEMHFGGAKNGMWTKESLKQHGLNKERYINAYKQMIAFYKGAFPKTNLFLNISPGQKKTNEFFRTKGYSWITPGKDEVIEYAVKEKINLRYDGLSLDGMRVSLKIISSYFNEFGIHEPNKKTGVKNLYEFGRSEKSTLTIKTLLNRAIQDPVSYINLNFQYFDKMSPEVVDILFDTAKKIGYRFVLQELSCPTIIKQNKNLEIINVSLMQIWQNKGIAPCYGNFVLKFSLVDSSQKIIHSQTNYPSIETWKWSPGSEVIITSQLTIPDDIPSGLYQLKVCMFDPHEKNQCINLAIGNKKEESGYDLFKFKADQTRDGLIISPL